MFLYILIAASNLEFQDFLLVHPSYFKQLECDIMFVFLSQQLLAIVP